MLKESSISEKKVIVSDEDVNLSKSCLELDNLSKEDLLVIRTIAKEYKRDTAVSSRITNIVGFLTELEIDNVGVENTKLYRKQYTKNNK